MSSIDGMIEKQLSRILHIIMMLSISESSIEEISEFLEVNEKTIKSDIQHFNTEFGNSQIFVNEFKFARLEVDQEVNVFELCQSVLKNSYNVLILYQIIKEEPTIKALGEANFISTTSVRRVIEKINACFVENKLELELVKLKNQKIKLIGDEILIRELGLNLLSDIFTKQDYEKYKWLSDELKAFFARCDLAVTQEVQKRVLLLLIISIYRVRNGYQLPEELTDQINNNQLLQNFYEGFTKNIPFISRVEDVFKIKFDTENMKQLFHFNIEFLDSQKIIQQDNFSSEDLVQYNNCHKFVQNFMSDFSLDEHTEQSLVVQTFKMIQFPQRLNAFKIDINSIFYEQIRKKNPELIRHFESCLQESEMLEAFNHYVTYKAALFLSYFMLSDELMEVVEKGLSTKSILIWVEEDEMIEVMYKKMIGKKYPHLTNIACYSELSEISQKFCLQDYDLILTDNQMTDVECIRISSVPTLFFWETLEKHIKM